MYIIGYLKYTYNLWFSLHNQAFILKLIENQFKIKAVSPITLYFLGLIDKMVLKNKNDGSVLKIIQFQYGAPGR